MLERERARPDMRGNFFPVRVVKQWIKLPEMFQDGYNTWMRNKPIAIAQSRTRAETKAEMTKRHCESLGKELDLLY